MLIEKEGWLFPGFGQTQVPSGVFKWFFPSSEVTRVLKMELYQLKNVERTRIHDVN